MNDDATDLSQVPEEPGFQELLLQCVQVVHEVGPSGIPPILDANPAHADALRERLAELDRFGLLPEIAPDAADQFPEHLGEFRLLRRLGGGGMGVVYLAEQESLRRRVALKLIRPEQLYFPKARERFQREVRISAGLQHPGIVPVFQVGESAGVPYFVMEHVDGLSLGEILERLADRNVTRLTAADLRPEAIEPGPGDAPGSGWIEAGLELCAQVADALAHAHEHGVLHRDVKPSNIMVTRDGRGRLVDFGLSSSRESSRITRTGSVLGSLAYLAPESLRREADERSDVYSLGVTLYELLTLRCPFLAEDSEVTRRHILAGEVPPLRTLNPRVSWEVETVCLAAMDRDPARRYPTAAAFAEDLRHVLAHRPIRARRPGPLRRARRLAQRHPAWSVGVVLGLGMLAATAYYAQQLHLHNTSLARAVQRKDQAVRELEQSNERLDAARRTAERNFERALQAGTMFLTQVGSDRLSRIPGIAEVRGELLDEAERFYGVLFREQPDNEAVRSEVARFYRLLGQFEQTHGDPQESERHLRQSIALLETLHAERGTDLDTFGQLSDARLALGNLLFLVGRTEEGQAVRSDALAELETVLDRTDESDPQWVHLSRRAGALLMNLGTSLVHAEPEQGVELFEEARWHLEEAIERIDTLAPEDRDGTLRMYLGVLTNLGAALDLAGRDDEVPAILDVALDEVDRRLEDQPGNPELELVRASVLGNLGAVEEDRDVKIDLYGQCADQLRETVRRNPSFHQARFGLVQALEILDLHLYEAGRSEEGRACLEEADRHARHLRDTLATPSAEQACRDVQTYLEKYDR